MSTYSENEGLRYFSQENYTRALEIFMENIEDARQKGEPERIAYNANLAGLCLYFLHRPEESFSYFDMAMENTTDEEREKIRRNMEEVERFIEKISNEIEELMSMLEAEQDRKKRGVILSNLGILHYLLGKNSEAEKEFQEAEKIFRDDRDKIALGAIYTNLAMLYNDMRKLDYLYRALDIFIEEGHIKGQIDTYHSLALYYLHGEEYEESYYFLKKEVELVSKIADADLRRRAYEMAADVAMEIGKVDEALRFTELASEL